MDDFLRPRAERYRRGEVSPEGCYRDTFDHRALIDRCVVPSAAEPAAVLLGDGVFLHRPELRDLWTVSVYLRVSEAEVLRRALTRDVERFGSAAEVTRRYRMRHLPAQALYRAEADPERVASIVIDNENPTQPCVVRWGH